MGIDVWVARHGPAAPAESAPGAMSQATALDPALREATPAAVSEPVSEPVSAPAARAGKPGAEPAPATAESVAGAEPPESAATVAEVPVRAAGPADISAVCVAGDGVVMLVDDCPTDQRRLLLDVFAAAAGRKRRAEGKELTFSFNGDAQAQGRAFAAFVDKQLADYDPRFVLCSEGLCGHLPQQSRACPVIVLPPLVELGNRVELKRKLWQQIQSHRT